MIKQTIEIPLRQLACNFASIKYDNFQYFSLIDLPPSTDCNKLFLNKPKLLELTDFVHSAGSALTTSIKLEANFGSCKEGQICPAKFNCDAREQEGKLKYLQPIFAQHRGFHGLTISVIAKIDETGTETLVWIKKE